MDNNIENFFNLDNKGNIYKSVINETERLLIEKALKQTNGNQILAARILGLNRNTLRAKIKKLQIDPVSYKY